jgi:hypothetical protein
VGAGGQPAALLTTGNSTLFESRGRANLKQASNKASIKTGPMGVSAISPKLTTQSSNKNGSVYLAKVSLNSTSKGNRSAVSSRVTSLNSTSRIQSTSAGQFKGNFLQDGSAVKNGSRLVRGGSSLLTGSSNGSVGSSSSSSSSSVRVGLSTGHVAGSGSQLLEAVGAVSTSPSAAGPSTANTGSLNDPSAGSPPLGPPANTTWPPTPESPKILIFYIKFLNVNAPRNSLTIR